MGDMRQFLCPFPDKNDMEWKPSWLTTWNPNLSGPGAVDSDNNPGGVYYPPDKNISQHAWHAMRRYCPFTCGFCPPDHRMGVACDLVVQRHLAILSEPEVKNHGKSHKVWDRLLSKAAFELGQSSLSYVIPVISDETTNDPNLFHPEWKQGEVLLLYHLSSVSLYEAESFSIMWLFITMMASCFIVAEIVQYYCTKGKMSAVITKVLMGVDFLPQDMHYITDEPRSYESHMASVPLMRKRDIFLVIARTILELGAMVGESVLPTHQMCPEWLYVDVAVIGTFERMVMVLLPRLSHLGIVGTLFNCFYITPPPTHALLVLLSYVALTTSGLVITVNRAVAGNNLETLYFLVPIISMVVCLAGITLSTIVSTYGKPEAPWQSTAGVRLFHASHHHAVCLYIVPPMWYHLAMILDETRADVDTHWVEFADTLVPWVPEADMPEVQTTMVLQADETEPARHYTVPKEVLGQLRGDEVNGAMTFLLSMKRMPRERPGKDKKREKIGSLEAIADAADILG